MSESHQPSLQGFYNDSESRIYATYEKATIDIRKALTREERYLRIQYQLISFLFNLITISQVIIGAAITALGPLGNEHMLAITILGAFNTSIAGLLALLKGRGLPERLRKNMVQIAKALDIIQEKATLLRYGDNNIENGDISLHLQEAFRAYFSAKEIIENNQTDTYADGIKSRASDTTGELNGSSIQRIPVSKSNGKTRQMDEEVGLASAI